MFFKLKVNGKNADLSSYIIVKNPTTIFERSIKNRGKVVAKFDKYEKNEVIYSGYTENDVLGFLKTCRRENLTNYVNSEGYSVCPYNLDGFNEVFRSVLRNNKPDGITEEDYNKKFNIEFILGPFTLYKRDFLLDCFEGCGYKVEVSAEGLVFTLKITGENTISTFLQQMYIISYALTSHLRYLVPSKEGIEKFVNLSKNWIEDHPKRNVIVNKLSKVKKNVKTFEVSLLDDDASDSEKKKKIEDIEEKFSPRQAEMRYQSIVSLLNEDDAVLDFGCATGNLLHRIINRKVVKKLIGFDANGRSTNIAYRRGARSLRINRNKVTKFRVHEGSILYPDYSLFDGINVVVLSEVIEHFHPHEVDEVLDVIFKGVNPERVIITTPNKDYNKNFDFTDDQLRHQDHKFEFTSEQVKEFAEKIKDKYNYSYDFLDITVSHVDDRFEPFNRLSFLIELQRGAESKKDEKMVERSSFIFSPYDLDISGYAIKKKEIRLGSCTTLRKLDQNWIIYLAPTMSPADCSDIEGYLEHPIEAIQYYLDRGVDNLIWETKYMGSRGIIVATRDKEISRELFKSNDTIKIYSRNGFNFFDEKEIDNEIYLEIKAFMEKINVDVIAIDCEIMPWCYKGKELIEKQFLKPGQCALMDKRSTNRDTTNEELYLKSLSNYSKNNSIEIRPFNIILEAKLNKGRLKEVKTGFHRPHDEQLEELKLLCFKSKYFKNVEYSILDLRYVTLSIGSKQEIINKWKILTENGVEGMVFKPQYPTCFLPDGRYVQPAIKCRGKDYLRIIYGIDYLDEKNLMFLKARKAGAKRKLAIQQYELGLKILHSFINGKQNQRLKYIFGFYGMENVTRIDATL